MCEHIEDFHRTVLMLGALALYAEIRGADDAFIEHHRPVAWPLSLPRASDEASFPPGYDPIGGTDSRQARDGPPTFRLDAVLVQAVIAGALSFAHLHDLAAAAGQDGWKAWAYPITRGPAPGRRLASAAHRWPVPAGLVLVPDRAVASLGANVATAGLLDLSARRRPGCASCVAGWPALAFLGGTLLAHSPTAEDRVPDPPAPAAPSPLRRSSRNRGLRPGPGARRDPRGSKTPAALPAADPTPTAPPVPAALVDHARKVADDHQARTGSRIDTDTLRARLGVPPQLAEPSPPNSPDQKGDPAMPARDHFHSADADRPGADRHPPRPPRPHQARRRLHRRPLRLVRRLHQPDRRPARRPHPPLHASARRTTAMDVPLWLALIVVGYLGVKLIRPPWWLVAVLLLGGYLLADSLLAPVIDTAVK